MLEELNFGFLVGKTVVKVEGYKAYGYINEVITFDDGTHLIAEDGEYGNTTFTKIDGEEYLELFKPGR